MLEYKGALEEGRVIVEVTGSIPDLRFGNARRAKHTSPTQLSDHCFFLTRIVFSLTCMQPACHQVELPLAVRCTGLKWKAANLR